MQGTVNLEITAALRTALKTKGITYKQVAKKIKVSEQTIKRLFKSSDCSLSRLNQICDAINISVYDLLEFSKYHTEPLTKLTKEQEVFLKNNPSHFSFLFFLTTNHSISDIKEKYGLSRLSIFRYLRDLDKKGFLELGEGNKFRLLVKGKLLMGLHGPLHEMLRHLNGLFLNHVINNDGANGTSFNSSFRYMSQETLDLLNDELTAINRKFRKIAFQNELILSRESLIAVKWSTLVSPYEICGNWPLEELEK